MMCDKELSLRAGLEIRRIHGAHMEMIANFWQECEVSIPNKPVPVPRSQLFRTRQNKRTDKLSHLQIQCDKMEESTSEGSGS
jgi:hypothetical protein